MRKSRFASLASLTFGLMLAVTGCQVGDDGGGGGDGDDSGDDGGDDGGNPGTPDAGPGAPVTCPPSAAEFKTDVFDVAIAPHGCAGAGCHGTGAGGFTLSTTDQAANLTAATNKAKKLVGGVSVLLLKPTGGGAAGPHGGGEKFAVGSTEYKALEKFVGQVTGAPGACD